MEYPLQKKAKPLSDSETKQTLISVAGKTVYKDKTRSVLQFVSIQRTKGTEYTVGTDGRRMTVISQPTSKPDTDTETHEIYDTKGVQYKKDRHSQPFPNWRLVMPDINKQQASTTIDLSYYSFLAKGSVKGKYNKRIESPLFKDGQRIFFMVEGHRAAIAPVFMRDIYKQMQELGKKFGFPPTLKVYYFDTQAPLVFTAEHNGITYQNLVMTIGDPVLDERGNHMREGGTYMYKTPNVKPGDIILGEQPTIYGSEQDTPQNTGTFSLRVSRDTIAKATSNKMKSKARIELCTLPSVLAALGENAPGIYNRAETIYKLAHKHKLTDEEIETIIKSLDDPLLVIKESSSSYIFYLPVEAKNKAGNMSPVMAALRMHRDAESGHYMMSAYPLENTQKIEERIRRHDVVYSKYDEATLSNSNAPSPFKPDLVRLMVKHGFTNNALTEKDIVHFKFAAQGISDSFPSQQETLVSSPEAKALFQDGVLHTENAIVTDPTLSIKALHVSPHNFRKFDTAYMGTGEGVQAYGWGLYFMTSTLVNRAYFYQFANSNKEPGILLDGQRMRRVEALNYFSEQLREIDSRYSAAKARGEMSYVLSDVSIIGGGMKAFLERAEKAVNLYSEKLKRNAFGYTEQGLVGMQIMRDVAQLLAEHDIQPSHPFLDATNYRVELNADDSNLLDWDNPVSDELFKAVDTETNNSLSTVGLKTARGKSIYTTLADYFESQQEASEWLVAHGYKGIK